MNAGRGTEGFTLIELLVVVALIGVLAAVSVPRIAARVPATEMQAAARQVRDAAEAARIGAILTGAEVWLRITAEGRSLGVTRPDPPPGSSAKVTPTPAPLPRLPTALFPGSLQAKFRPESGGDRMREGIIRFFPDGSSDSGDLVLWREREEQTLRLRGALGRFADGR